MGRYSKNLSGYGARTFVSPAIEYTDDTTFAAFVDNAPEGEIGVFLEAGTVRTTLLTAGVKFFIAQKKDGLITKTPILDFADLIGKRRTAYDAPVKQVSTVGYNGTSGDVGIDLTGASATAPKGFGISIRETTPGNQPFPVQEAFVAITSASYDEYTLLADLCRQLNADFDYKQQMPDRFVKAEITANGALTEHVEDATVTNGSVTVTYAGNVTIATGALVSYRGVIYKVKTGVTAGTSITLDRPYQGDTETIDVSATTDLAATMAYTSGTTLLGLKLTSLRFESHFVVTVTDGLANAPLATATAWKLGAGSYDSILALEQEQLFFDGMGSVYNAAFRDDYGIPSTFATSGKEYHQIFLDFAPSVTPSAALPVYKQHQIQRIIIAAPNDATTPDNEFQTIFGV